MLRSIICSFIGQNRHQNLLDPVVIDFEDEPGWGYIPASAFEKKGKKLKITVSDKEFAQYREELDKITQRTVYGDELIINTPKLASTQKQRKYYNANWQAYGVAGFAYSTINDMKKAEVNLKTGVSDMDGDPVQVSGTPDNFTLTEDQKDKILKLGSRLYDTDNAWFSSDGQFLIYIDRYVVKKPIILRHIEKKVI